MEARFGAIFSKGEYFAAKWGPFATNCEINRR